MLKLRLCLAAGVAAFVTMAAGSASADCCATYTASFIAPRHTITIEPVLVKEPHYVCCGVSPGVVEYRPTFRTPRVGVITYERGPGHYQLVPGFYY
jgi:hypothetical protein